MNKLFFDGAITFNPGGSATWGYVIDSKEHGCVKGCGFVGRGPEMTVNVAEYAGLYNGLLKCAELGLTTVKIFGDSKLVVKQVTGKWRCHKPHLSALIKQVQTILKAFEYWRLKWIPRENNWRADKMSKSVVFFQDGSVDLIKTREVC